MIIQLEMGDNFNQVVRDLGEMGKAVVKACSAGLHKGVKQASQVVARDYLSGQNLKRRSGTLAREVDGWLASDFDGVVGVPENSPASKYSWLLGDETKTIVPKKGKFLSIPIGENLTGTGVARYSSPRQVEEGFFVRTGGQLFFGYKRGKKGKFRALFVMVKSVTIHGSGALIDGVLGEIDNITAAMQNEISKVKGVDSGN